MLHWIHLQKHQAAERHPTALSQSGPHCARHLKTTLCTMNQRMSAGQTLPQTGRQPSTSVDSPGTPLTRPLSLPVTTTTQQDNRAFKPAGLLPDCKHSHLPAHSQRVATAAPHQAGPRAMHLLTVISLAPTSTANCDWATHLPFSSHPQHNQAQRNGRHHSGRRAACMPLQTTVLFTQCTIPACYHSILWFAAGKQ